MKYFTSDQHFNHGTLAKVRNIESVKLMNEMLIQAWNEVVPTGGLVYQLGDLIFPFKKDGDLPGNILDQLNGQIILVMGNHDHKNENLVKGHKKIVKICDIEYIKLQGGYKVMMCHYPMITWRASCHGSWSLHGHSHGKDLKTPGLRLDVGVDTNHYFPYDEHQIINYFLGKGKEEENIDSV